MNKIELTDEEKAREAEAARLVGLLPDSRLDEFKPGRNGYPDEVAFSVGNYEGRHSGHGYRFAYYEASTLVRYLTTCARAEVARQREILAERRGYLAKTTERLGAAEQGAAAIEREAAS